MSPAHLHLLVNHVPIIGAAFGVGVLLLALIWPRDRGILRAAALILVISAAGAGVALASGEPAEEQIEDLAGVSESAVEVHEERAEIALYVSIAAGVASLGLLALSESRRQASRLAVGAALTVALASAATMAWTGLAGGTIRHSEIRDERAPLVRAEVP